MLYTCVKCGLEEGADHEVVWDHALPLVRGCSPSSYSSVQPPELQKCMLMHSDVCLCVEQAQLQAPQVYFRAAKAPCLMAGATAVTAVTRDFMGSFTSLAPSFSDNFIMPSPQLLSLMGKRPGA